MKARLPKYLEKDGFTTLVIGQVRLKGNKFVLPYSMAYSKTHEPVEITIPPILEGKKVKKIKIVPKANDRFFEIQYVYVAEEAQRKLDPYKALALDFGIDNLVTGLTNDGKTFIVDGRTLKAINLVQQDLFFAPKH